MNLSKLFHRSWMVFIPLFFFQGGDSFSITRLVDMTRLTKAKAMIGKNVSSPVTPNPRIQFTPKTTQNLNPPLLSSLSSPFLSLMFAISSIFFLPSILIQPAYAESITDTSTITIAATAPTSTNTVDEGISIITDSSLGRAIRKSTIQSARVVDNLDEKWERFSDSLRDKNKCDEATGRRLFDNGFRKDGTRIGNPVLGALCNPIELEPLNQNKGASILDYALSAAASSSMTDTTKLRQNVEKVESLVRPSFERSIANIDENSQKEERQRKLYNFESYTNMKAINDELKSSTEIKNFYLTWGKLLISNLAPPDANKDSYSSPFPEMKDEFEDYDYDKDKLLDSLGMLNAALKTLQQDGLIGHYEISIPYDDYGSVVTLAVDDDITLGSQILLREQGMRMSGSSVESMVRYVIDKANIKYNLDSFFIDPSTTKQSEYNPTQLLLSLSNLQQIKI